MSTTAVTTTKTDVQANRHPAELERVPGDEVGEGLRVFPLPRGG